MEFPARQPRAALLDELREVVATPGPFLSVFIGLLDEGTPAHERFRILVEAEDLPSSLVERVVGLIREAERGDDGLFACVASAHGPLVATSYPDPPSHDVVDLADVPRLAPIIESEQTLIHHVIAVIDAAGLTLISTPRHGEAVRESLIGNNPEGAAELITRVAMVTDTSLVLIVGPDEMLDEVHPLVVRDGRLFCPILRIATDGQPDPAGIDPANALVRHVADRTARRLVDALRIYRYFESHDAARDGVVNTVEALREGRASMLLIHDDPDDERQGWFGASPMTIGHDLNDIEQTVAARAGAGQLEETFDNGRLVDVLVRSALGQRVPVMVVPSLPEDRLADGMGVILHVEGFADSGLADLVER